MIVSTIYHPKLLQCASDDRPMISYDELRLNFEALKGIVQSRKKEMISKSPSNVLQF